MRRSVQAAATLLALAAPVAVSGQVHCPSTEVCGAPMTSAGVGQELSTAGLNALLGGATTAALSYWRGEPVWDGFWKGAVGGGLVYAGKRVAVEDFRGAGLVGRQLAGAGGSIVRNTAAGRPALDEMVFSLGPVRLYVSGTDGVVPRLDVATVVAAGAMVLSYDGRLDLGESLSAGAIVFTGESPTPGLNSAGVLMVWDRVPASEGPRLLAHERVHVIQHDQMYLSWGERPERWLADRVPLPGGILRHLDLGGLMLGVRSGANALVGYGARPWEQEAYILSLRAHPVPADAMPHAH